MRQFFPLLIGIIISEQRDSFLIIFIISNANYGRLNASNADRQGYVIIIYILQGVWF